MALILNYKGCWRQICILAICLGFMTVPEAYKGVALQSIRVCQGECAFSSVQAAIQAAQYGAEITVEPGVYRENLDFFGKRLTVSSIDPGDPDVIESTILEGSSEGSVVTFQLGEPAGTTLTGFTIKNGSGTELTQSLNRDPRYFPTPAQMTESAGGAILILNGSQPIIENNYILGNSAYWGAGIFIAGDFSNPVIRRNVFRDNKGFFGSGILIRVRANPEIIQNTFHANLAYMQAGAIHSSEYSKPLIDGNEFVNNTGHLGGALFLQAFSDPTITNNTFRGNHGLFHGGAIEVFDSSPIITNNVFEENISTEGGAINIRNHASPVIVDNSFIRNYAEAEGGGIHLGMTSTIHDSSGQELSFPDSNNTWEGNSPNDIFERE